MEEKDERDGRRSAARKTNKVWRVIGTGIIGILMKAPAATRAEKSEINIIMAKAYIFPLRIVNQTLFMVYKLVFKVLNYCHGH